MIEELVNNKEKYLWSRSVAEEDTFNVGGMDGGRFMGLVQFRIKEDRFTMHVTQSDGVGRGQTLPPRSIEKGTPPFDILSKFFAEFDTYFELESTKLNYELNRSTLLKNLFDLLPRMV